jgi:hypothetical protein
VDCGWRDSCHSIFAGGIIKSLFSSIIRNKWRIPLYFKPDQLKIPTEAEGGNAKRHAAVAWINGEMSIPVIFMPAHSDARTIERARATGACIQSGGR